MDEFIARLSEILMAQFPGCIADLEQIRPLQRVGGFLIWQGFDGVEQIDRQRQISTAIRNNLQPHEQLMVSTILTVTPEESELMRAD